MMLDLDFSWVHFMKCLRRVFTCLQSHVLILCVSTTLTTLLIELVHILWDKKRIDASTSISIILEVFSDSKVPVKISYSPPAGGPLSLWNEIVLQATLRGGTPVAASGAVNVALRLRGFVPAQL